jgi:molybdopterin molybdotransferase
VRVEPAEAGRYTARVTGAQGSAMLSSLVLANGLLVVPEDVSVAEPGDLLTVQWLDWEMG